MHIGDLARAAGVNIQTIRFYERRQLLRKPLRSESGYRCYEQADLDQVLFIKRNQELGFTLDEIKQLAELHAAVVGIPKPIRRKPAELLGIAAIGAERLKVIDAKLKALRSMRRQLASLIDGLDRSTVQSCPAGATKPKRQARCPAGADASASGR